LGGRLQRVLGSVPRGHGQGPAGARGRRRTGGADDGASREGLGGDIGQQSGTHDRAGDEPAVDTAHPIEGGVAGE
jgi:hypothetical protein